MLTGPQGTPEQRGDLAELAGFYAMTPAVSADVQWWDVTELHRARGWNNCSAALADVAIAESFGIPVMDLVT